jgi:hypothetical protein
MHIDIAHDFAPIGEIKQEALKCIGCRVPKLVDNFFARRDAIAKFNVKSS